VVRIGLAVVLFNKHVECPVQSTNEVRRQKGNEARLRKTTKKNAPAGDDGFVEFFGRGVLAALGLDEAGTAQRSSTAK
jgi:hypothetical protein